MARCTARGGAVGSLLLAAALFTHVSTRLDAADFLRGDCNQNGDVDISDAQFVLNLLFLGGRESTCPVACDSNDDEQLNVSDPQYLLNFLFLGGPPPRLPWGVAGRDPTSGPLACGDVAPPESLFCAPDGPAVDLSWRVRDVYDEIEVLRGGEVVAVLAGDATSHRDLPCSGGLRSYEVRGVVDGEATDPATCSTPLLPRNIPPDISIRSPAQGASVSPPSVEVIADASDETRLARVVIGGGDVLPVGQSLAAYAGRRAVALAPGPNLVRVEAVDEFGAASFAELVLARQPFLRRTDFAPGIAFDLTGGRGYNELETVLRPLLAGLPGTVDDVLRGRQFSTTQVGATFTVTVSSVTMSTPTLDLIPSSEGGGRVVLRSTISEGRMTGSGRADFPFPIPDDNNWTVTAVARNIVMEAKVRFAPNGARTGVTVTSDPVNVTIGSVDVSISGLGDPLGILDAIVNFFIGTFGNSLESEIRDALADAAQDLVLSLGDALSDVAIPEIALGGVTARTRFAEVVESSRGLSILLDATWEADAADPSFPAYPGSLASGAPFPSSFSTSPDGTISFSVDTLNQALLELTSTGALAAAFDLAGVESPLELTVESMATLLDDRLLCVPGVSASDALDLRVEARMAPTVSLATGGAAAAAALGEVTWRHASGASEAIGDWTAIEFDDGGWSGDALPLEVAAESLRLRGAFDVADLFGLSAPVLRVRTDGGFVAFVNGVEVASEDAPDTPSEPRYVDVPLAEHLELFRHGMNVVAISGSAHADAGGLFVEAEVFEQRELARVDIGEGGGAGLGGGLPGRLELRELEVTFSADGVDLFGLAIGFDATVEVVIEGQGLVLRIDATDGPDADTLPDAIVGGIDGVDMEVSYEAVDIDDELLLVLGEIMLQALGPEFGELLAGFELPAVPLPELSFDTGGATVRLRIVGGSLVALDTNGGEADWMCILADLEP